MKLSLTDLDFLLAQLNAAAPGSLYDAGGVRLTSGEKNNLSAGQTLFGAVYHAFPVLTLQVDSRSADLVPAGLPPGMAPPTGAPTFYNDTSTFVVDSTTRETSNLVSLEATAHKSKPIADEFNALPASSFLTMFGQFATHDLDLIPKGKNGVVYMPLLPGDPLHVPGGQANFMILSRANIDGIAANGDRIYTNTVSSFVDLGPTYGTHPVMTILLREYDASGVATGKLLSHTGATDRGAVSGGLPTWFDVKANALKIGISLTDPDVLNLPQLVLNADGTYAPGADGKAQFVVVGSVVQRTGLAFLNDIQNTASPKSSSGALLLPDANGLIGIGGPSYNWTTPAAGFYDNELLDIHFIGGDGRLNENYTLTTVHAVFFAEHNRALAEIQALVQASGQAAQWTGEMYFQAAKLVNEAQYQRIVFDEYVRHITPNLGTYAGYVGTLDPAITAEFAQAVFRFGHSQAAPDVTLMPSTGGTVNGPLLGCFLNPLVFGTLNGALTGQGSEAYATALLSGMVRKVSNEIDEFVTSDLRDSLVGLPLDLAALNIARGRDVGIPPLNTVRAVLHGELLAAGMTAQAATLTPYGSWTEFGANLLNPSSLKNFIMAYAGTDLRAGQTWASLRTSDWQAYKAALSLAADAAMADTTFMGSGASGNKRFNDIDLWLGGLAEKKVPGGRLGSTFDFVFAVQMTALRDADRFFFERRLADTDLLPAIEGRTLADLIMAALPAKHLYGDVFSAADAYVEIGTPSSWKISPDRPDIAVNDARIGAGWSLASNVTFTATGLSEMVGGRAAVDIVFGGAGNDTIYGDGGADTLDGQDGNDTVYGGIDADTIADTGSSGAAIPGSSFLSQSNDLLHGNDGNDNINAGAGNDKVYGDEGNDTLHGGAGNDTLDGGAGVDTAVMANARNEYTVLRTGTDTYTLTHVASGEIDALINDEFVQFSDLSLALTTGKVAVNDGTPVQNQVLTALSTLANTAAFSITGYQWQVSNSAGSWSNISGATQSSYVPGVQQITQQLRVVVTYTDAIGTSQQAMSSPTFAATNVNGAPGGGLGLDNLIPMSGQSQTLSVVNMSSLADPNGLPTPASYVWQWQSAPYTVFSGANAWSNIAAASNTGATANALAVTAALNGLHLRALLSYTDGSGLLKNVFTGVSSPVSTGVLNATPINGTSGVDSLIGTAGRDTLNGLDGNDSLNGAADGDTLSGGLGNDSYFIDHPNDVVIESSGEGTDTEFAWITRTLSANVENLSLRGEQPIAGAGNALGNIIYGNENSAANVLSGAAGNDTYVVGPGDTLLELPGEGTDTAIAYVDFTLPANVENLSFSASGSALVGSGNELGNVLTGNALANSLSGLGGNDTLTGGLGNDTLDGGAGTDTAVIAGTQAEHSIVRTGDNAYTVTKIASGEIDTWRNIEVAQFTGPLNIALTTGGVAVNTATPMQGQLLGVASTLANAASLSITGYQWQSSADGLTGWTNVATSASYTPDGTQVGRLVRVTASFTDATGNTYQAVSPATAAVAVATTNVVIDGSATENQVLTANTNAVQGLGPFTYQWLRNDVAIGTATAPSYTLGDADVGQSIKLRVSYSDGQGGTAQLTSLGSAPVLNVNDAPVAALGLDNPVAVTGASLGVINLSSLVDLDGLPGAPASYSWQWQSAPYTIFSGANAWSNIAGAVNTGATATPLSLTAALNGLHLRALLSYTDANGTPESVITAVSSPVSTGVLNATPINGTSGVDSLIGTAGRDTLNGLDGNDSLNGAADGDTLSGGLGNDSYFIDHPNDVVIESSGEGTDTEFAWITRTLSANVENLSLRGEQPIAGAGNALGNIIYGNENSAANVLSGAAGNDTYVVGPGDTLLELPGEGTDTAIAYVDFTLPANVENLSFSASGSALVGSGNELGNVLTGNALANSLSGLGGNDTLTGGLGNDTLDGGAGTDTAVIAGTQAEHSIVRTGDNAYTVTKIASGEIDTWRNIEVAQFTGPLNIALTTGGVAVNTATPMQGQLLGVASTLANAASLSITGYQWQSSADGLTGWTNVATSASYTPDGTQVGRLVRVTASFTDATGNTYQAVSPATAAVAVATTNVVIDGSATENQVLTANTNAVQGLGPFTYQWLRNDVAIGTATAPSYTLGDADVGQSIKLRVSYSDGQGGTAQLTSLGSAPVLNVNDAPVAALGLDNPVAVTGASLGVINLSSLVDLDGLPGAPASYSWQWQSAPYTIFSGANAWSNIAGAVNTGATATPLSLTAALNGLHLRALLSYTDANGTPESVITAVSSPVSTGVLNATPINGTSGVDSLIGTAGRDTLNGLDGNDSLNGAADGDTLSGGLGNDSYFIDHPNDVVIESSGEGTDTEFAWITRTLSANVENLSLRGEQPIAGAGNALGNIIYGNENSAANVLSGAAGNDTYVVGPGDTLLELPGEGTDTAIAYVDFTLPANVENLSFSASGSALVGSGNELGNVLTGNALANSLSGLGGNDTLTGGLGNDTLDGGAGTDTAVIAGTQAEHSIVRTGDNAYTVTKIASGEIDTWRNIEVAQFTGPLNIALTTGGVAVNTATPMQGQLLGVASTLANAASLSITGYQWQSSADGLTGWTNVATSASYTPDGTQVGRLVRVTASFTDATGNTYQAVSPATAAVAVATTNVVIDGSATENQVLTANTNAVQGLGPFTYQWLRNDVAIGTATAPSYTLGDADVGQSIKLRVSYSDGQGGTAQLTSLGSAPVLNVNDAPVAALGLDNPVAVTGASLGVINLSSLVDLDGLPGAPASYSWQWQSAPYTIFSGANAWSNIAGAVNTGATATPLSLTAALNGLHLRALLSYTDANGTPESVITAVSSPVSTGVLNATPINGTSGVDSLIGTAGRDTLNGLDGNDSLNGAADGDTLSGGLGNDSYFIDHPNDVVIESSGEGTDTEFAWITRTLSANVENLSLRGEQPIAGAGNALGNIIYGNENSAANVLSGAAGNDTYVVGPGDTLLELPGEGTDTAIAYVDFTLPANVENLSFSASGSALVGSGNELGNVLTGNALANSLSGLGGNDTLTGGLGNDTLDGGAGTDTAVIAGTQAEHSIVFVGGATYTVTKNATLERETLIGVESVRFSDITVTLDTSGGMVNHAPSGTDTTLNTAEDTPVVLAASSFGFSDAADSPAHTLLAVRIATLPLAGTLSLNGAAVSAGQNIVAADIAAGLLIFTPSANANGSGYASLSFQVQDNGGTANGGVDLDPSPNTLTLNVSAVNDEQLLATNTGLTVAENSSDSVISAAMLSTSDVDHTPAQLVYQLSAPPTHGTLLLSGNVLSVGATFTQADIDAGSLRYSHDASETSADGFGFSVDDGLGVVTSASFAIAITPLNDNAPVITSNGGGSTAALNVAENANAVTTVTATDADLPAATLLYSLSGADAARFQIDASGVLSFVSAPDFELPGDVGTDNVYDVTVAVSDGALVDAQDLAVTVNDVVEAGPPNNPPAGTDQTLVMVEDSAFVFTLADFGFSDAADSPAHTLLAVRIATLPLAGTLSLNGAAVSAGQNIVAADIAAGLLIFTPSANANGSGYASLSFQVQDNGGTANGGVDLDPSPNTLTLNVSAVNDEQLLATNTGLTVAENSSDSVISAAMLSTSDVDHTPAQLVYQLSAPPTHGTLLLSGNVLSVGATFTQADIDAGSLRYSHDASETSADGFGFSVDDGLGVVTSASFAIAITPLNDNAPVITSNGGGSTAALNVAENANAVTTVTATDADLPAATLLYSLSGADAARFQIDASGVLSFVSAPDFELPGDVGTDNVYDVTVAVSDGALVDAQDLAVTVNDVVEAGPPNNPPAGTDQTLVMVEDSAFVFTLADFGFSDAADSPAHTLLAVRIATLPLAGTLSLNSAAVSAGQNIVAADIAAGLLIFTPGANANGSGYASLSFQVQDNGGTANGGVDLDPTANALVLDVTPTNDPLTGALTIDIPLPKVNEVLSVTSTLADIDGLPGLVSYRWQSFSGGIWDDISGATATSFGVTAAQNGLPLRVRATFTDDGGTPETADSAVMAAVSGSIVNGTGAADNLLGTDGNDILYALAGNDTLDGGLGTDTLHGDVGDDTFIIDNALDVAIEPTNGGFDAVFSSVSWSLGDNFQNLTLTGAAAIDGFGNSLNNMLSGNSAVNTLAGGSGDDTYVVGVGDVVIENAGEGSDTVQSSITWSLATTGNVENLTLTGSSAIDATGNTLNNVLTGNSAVNTLAGGTGDDTYLVGAGDVVTEAAGAGTDTIQSSVTWSLAAIANVENLTLTGTVNISGTGNTLNNTLVGNTFANILNGGTGNDNMAGDTGNDTYVVDSTSDVVTEVSGLGTDLVQSSVTWTLGAYVENLTLTGTANRNGTGNALANILSGNSGNNVLAGNDGNDSISGAAGIDTLRGGLGVDTMTGGSGNDIFDFDAIADSGASVSLRDIISDFVGGQDRIDLSTIDANSGAGGNQAFSFIGTAAFTAAAQVRYFFDGPNTILEGNVGGANGNAVDFQIILSGNYALLSTDLIP